jgi:hypothetical protein
MNREDVLLWLNDHANTAVTVETRIRKGDLDATVVSAAGVLRHWRTAYEHVSETAGLGRDDIMGWYAVGEDAHIDLTDVDPAFATISDLGDLVVELSPGVFLTVVVADESGAQTGAHGSEAQ